jgi:hypothetical protein
MRKLFLLFALFASGLSTAAAQTEVACETAGFSADPMSRINVREGAGTGHRVIKTLPRDPGGTLVFINGARGDWVKISSAVNSKKTRIFSGTGWVHAPLLSTRTSSRNDDLIDYFLTPDRKSEKIGSIRSEFDLNLMGCSGSWVRVAVPLRGTDGVKAWLPRGSYCGSPWEDCM